MNSAHAPVNILLAEGGGGGGGKGRNDKCLAVTLHELHTVGTGYRVLGTFKIIFVPCAWNLGIIVKNLHENSVADSDP